ncbi:MAG TPA: glycosyltransferase family 2 protein [Bacteroidia bacterium]|jgi:glycosyltransferase involved in cell wall biosynthesis|nr:glycosyltransferase family 2 protein [Bacteroidia bacterium]
MPKLSVVIITRNEEKNIGRCIDSVKDIADDIVVIDSFSTDRTEEICKSKGARFFQHAFEGHIEQKNYAVTLTQYPNVLSLDADEALDEELKKNIIEVKNNWKFDGYEMNRLTNYCGTWIRHCGWYPDTKLRLFDKRKGKWSGTNPHDKYELEQGSTFGKLKGDILHYSYYTIEDHYKQIEYFTTINAKASFEKGKKAPVWKLWIAPVVKFIKDYFIRLGFLDGQAGWQICRLSAWATYVKYKKLRALYKA